MTDVRIEQDCHAGETAECAICRFPMRAVLLTPLEDGAFRAGMRGWKIQHMGIRAWVCEDCVWDRFTPEPTKETTDGK